MQNLPEGMFPITAEALKGLGFVSQSAESLMRWEGLEAKGVDIPADAKPSIAKIEHYRVQNDEPGKKFKIHFFGQDELVVLKPPELA